MLQQPRCHIAQPVDGDHFRLEIPGQLRGSHLATPKPLRAVERRGSPPLRVGGAIACQDQLGPQHVAVGSNPSLSQFRYMERLCLGEWAAVFFSAKFSARSGALER